VVLKIILAVYNTRPVLIVVVPVQVSNRCNEIVLGGRRQ